VPVADIWNAGTSLTQNPQIHHASPPASTNATASPKAGPGIFEISARIGDGDQNAEKCEYAKKQVGAADRDNKCEQAAQMEQRSAIRTK
jgi:hypothetical protein